MDIEKKHTPPFFKKSPVSIEYGKGVYLWDENGNKYLDFTSGWGVTCIGHANEVIIEALKEQGQKIIQNPNGGLTYSPARARLLKLLMEITDDITASDIVNKCLLNGLLLNMIQGNCIRIIPALNIKMEELDEGFLILEERIKR